MDNLVGWMPLVMTCYRTVYYPDKWRNNLILPIHKGDLKTEPNNDRGIAISSCVGKLSIDFRKYTYKPRLFIL